MCTKTADTVAQYFTKLWSAVLYIKKDKRAPSFQEQICRVFQQFMLQLLKRFTLKCKRFFHNDFFHQISVSRADNQILWWHNWKNVMTYSALYQIFCRGLIDLFCRGTMVCYCTRVIRDDSWGILSYKQNTRRTSLLPHHLHHHH